MLIWDSLPSGFLFYCNILFFLEGSSTILYFIIFFPEISDSEALFSLALKKEMSLSLKRCFVHYYLIVSCFDLISWRPFRWWGSSRMVMALSRYSSLRWRYTTFIMSWTARLSCSLFFPFCQFSWQPTLLRPPQTDCLRKVKKPKLLVSFFLKYLRAKCISKKD